MTLLYFYVAALFKHLKKIVNVKNVSKFLHKLRHCFKRNKMTDAQEFLSVFGKFYVFYVIFGYIVNEISEKMQD